jgi:hypothetical protein
MTSMDALKRAVQRLAASAETGGHLEPGELIAYAKGDESGLAGEAIERIQEHLATCGECSRLLVDLAAFETLEPPEGGPRLSATEAAAARERFDRRIADEGVAAPAPAARPAPAPPPGPRRPAARLSAPPWRLLAASLAAVAIALAVWSAALLQRLRRLERPEVNVATYDLEPVGSDQVRAGGAAAPPPAVELGSGAAILLLQLPGTADYPAYRLAVRTEDGRRIVSFPGAVRDPDLGNFTLALPRDSLSAGRYEVEVFGLADGREDTLARYPIEVRSDAAP